LTSVSLPAFACLSSWIDPVTGWSDSFETSADFRASSPQPVKKIIEGLTVCNRGNGKIPYFSIA
ncbi:MAG: hypothetical protein WB769_00925, partial [Pseudolabrys sp.]